MDATAQAELVRRREASPLELVDAAIQRIQNVNPQLNAVVWERFEKARQEARSADLPEGPFQGVPFLTKDLGCTTAGEPDSGGSRFLKENSNVASVTTELARRIRAAGFINLGRTNTPEFGAVANTEPLAWGATRNPWDPTRTAGGSSGGSCAAVAALMVPVAHGSDGGGSIRVPASACGLVGLKPTRGRVNMWPSTEWLSPVSVQGFQTRTVRDLAACMDFASGPLAGDAMPPPAPLDPTRVRSVRDAGKLRIGLWNRLPGAASMAVFIRNARKRWSKRENCSNPWATRWSWRILRFWTIRKRRPSSIASGRFVCWPRSNLSNANWKRRPVRTIWIPTPCTGWSARAASARRLSACAGRHGRVHTRVRGLVGQWRRWRLRCAAFAGDRHRYAQTGSAGHGFGPLENLHAVVAVHGVLQYVGTAGDQLAITLVQRRFTGGRPIRSGLRA